MSKESAQPRVSVIVSTYQRPEFLGLTLASIVAQTYENLETIVVSDGHDTATEAVVSELNDPRVTYCYTPHAGFPAVPRNEGLRRSTGDFLAFCDDDDLWYPEKIAEQVPLLQEGKYGMCTTDYDYVDQHGKRLARQNFYSDYFGQIDWRTFFHSMGFICNAAVLFTREMYEKTGDVNEDPELRSHEDFEYWMRMLFQCEGIFMKQKLVSYRVHSGSIQRDTPWKVLKKRLALHRVLKQQLAIPAVDVLRKRSKLLAHYLFDEYPWSKQAFRRLQNRHGSASSHA